jgi:hypothetical protein
MNIIQKYPEALPDASKEAGLELNTEKTTYMFMSHHQNERQIPNLLTANKSFVNVTKFKYLGTTSANENYIL